MKMKILANSISHGDRPKVPENMYEFQALIEDKLQALIPKHDNYDPLDFEVASAVTAAELCAIWETYPHLTVAETIIICERHYLRQLSGPPEHRRYAEQAKRLSLYAAWESTTKLGYPEPWDLKVMPINSVVIANESGDERIIQQLSMLHITNHGDSALVIITDQSLIWMDRKSRHDIMQLLDEVVTALYRDRTKSSPVGIVNMPDASQN